MSETSDILASEAAAAFARHFFGSVRSTSRGAWVRYRDIYNAAISELGDNAFVKWVSVHPQRRAKVKYVLASVARQFADVERRKDGTAQSSVVWYRSSAGAVEIVTDPAVVEKHFARWRKAMLRGGRWTRGVCETPEGVLAATFPLKARRSLGEALGLRVSLGYDPRGSDWIIQVNQPTAPKTHNVHSAIARDTDGRTLLVRQGTLQANRRNPARITGAAFREATGLEPIPAIHNGKPSPRKWYVVAYLDETLDRIRRATADFVGRCDAARALGSDAKGAADEARLDELFGADEKDGSHTRPGRTTEDCEVPHIQGAVWRRLKKLLDTHGLKMTKPRHRQGYEVDGFIALSPVAVLLEIKTSAGAAAVQTGVGQLHLYPHLIPRVANARKMLLVRGEPRPALVQAIRKAGVELHSYSVEIDTGRVTAVTFSDAFLAEFGIG